MTAGIVITIVALFVVLALISRQSTKNKKLAIADLEQEREAVGKFDILELVKSEVQALGLSDIEGANDIPLDVLLRVWRGNEGAADGCDSPSCLRYVISPGVVPTDATDDDVTLECTESGDR